MEPSSTVLNVTAKGLLPQPLMSSSFLALTTAHGLALEKRVGTDTGESESADDNTVLSVRRMLLEVPRLFEAAASSDSSLASEPNSVPMNPPTIRDSGRFNAGAMEVRGQIVPNALLSARIGSVSGTVVDVFGDDTTTTTTTTTAGGGDGGDGGGRTDNYYSADTTNAIIDVCDSKGYFVPDAANGHAAMSLAPGVWLKPPFVPWPSQP